jgi:hypothetical protein
MRTTLSWATPAVLLACTVGCGQDPATAKKTPAPSATVPKSDVPPALSANLVTLHVPEMV